MSMDPRDTVNKAGTDPNQGMNARNYLVLLVVAVVVILAVLLVGIFGLHGSNKPGTVTQPTSTGKSNPAPQ